jgi:voltage-gated potassium channel
VNHRSALITITLAAALDACGGIAFASAEHVSDARGLYWAVVTATTVGYGDVTPETAAGRWIAVAVMLTVIPLFGATFSLFTSGLTDMHVRGRLHDAEARIKAHTEDRLRHHHQDLLERLNGGGSG